MRMTLYVLLEGRRAFEECEELSVLICRDCSGRGRGEATARLTSRIITHGEVREGGHERDAFTHLWVRRVGVFVGNVEVINKIFKFPRRWLQAGEAT